MHGGDIYRNNIKLDFSVNINPFGMPENALDVLNKAGDLMGKYPDISCEKLKKKIALYHNVPYGRVVCGNGASELILGICLMEKAQKALLNAPSFSGYERSLNSSATRIYYNYLNSFDNFRLTEVFAEKILNVGPKLVFVTNPNNPDGNLVSLNTREKILEAIRETGSLLIADECFIEMTMENEGASFLQNITKEDNAIVLRAFTKSYGMPGLRLAYAICSDERIAERLNGFLPEWNVSSIAQEVGEKVFGDEKYLKESRMYISRERKYLSDELRRNGMKVYGSSANFILFEDMRRKDESLYAQMLGEGILIRDCSDYMGLKNDNFRVAVKDHESNEKLIEAIRKVRG